VVNYVEFQMAVTGLRKLRFGDFEVDLVSGELRKFGTRIKLQDQPFKVLSILLASPGEIVTREELQERIWPANTFVDFDQSLNKAINKIREALSDSADGPRFVETLPRRGYRFIAAVERIEQASAAASDRKVALRTRFTRWALALAAVASLIGFAVWRTSPPPTVRITGSVQLTHDGREKLSGTLFSDSARLYFAEDLAYHASLVQVPVRGGRTVPVPSALAEAGKEVVVQDISYTRGEALVTATSTNGSDAPLWAIPLGGGDARRLGDLVAHAGAWSPDAKHLAYSAGDHLFVADADGYQSRKIATLNTGGGSALRWSPDAKKLRFNMNDPATHLYTIWEIGVDGLGLHELLPSSKRKFLSWPGCWTRDGKWFLFLSRRGETNHIYAISEGEGRTTPAPIQLSFGPISYVALAPGDDKRTVYAIGHLRRGELVRYEPRLGQFAPYASGPSADRVDFSHDGEWMAYAAYPGGALWRSKRDGAQRLQLSPEGMQAHLPRWSPDGQWIAFTDINTAPHWRLYIVSSEGGAPRRLPPDHIAMDPTWSPDGHELMFSHGPPPINWLAPFLKLENRVKLRVSILDLRNDAITDVPGSEGLWSPRWSPDGKFALALGNDFQVMLGDLSNQKWTEINHGPAAYPQWSRDGQSIYFLRTMGQDAGIFRIGLANRKLELVYDMKTAQLPTEWFGLAPDNSLIAMRDTGSKEIYALDLETR
jgi:DNA-binding winged helix-turn-helix (wHTH) protein/Tol biopolymer transport system component